MMSFYNRKTDEPYDYSQARSIPNKNTAQTSVVSQYNPASSNYWAKSAVKTAPAITTPQTQTTPKTTPTPQASTSDQLIQKLSQIAKDRAAVEEQRAAQQAQRLTERQNAAAAMLPTQQATLEAAKEKAIGNIKSGISTQEAQTAEDKQAIEELYGAQQREAMQAQREEQGNLQNLFAGLGTVDSSVFQNQAANSAARLTGRTQSISAQKTRDLVAANRALSEYKTIAQQLIDQEQANFDTALQNIQNTYAQGTQEYNDAIIAAYATAQDNIYQIENEVTQKELAFEQEKAKLGLTDSSQNSEKSASKVRGIIEALKPMNTKGITGLMRFGWSDESRNAAGLLKQLSSELQLEEAKRMKGQGTMTESERAILANSVASLNLDANGLPQVSDQRFKQIMDELYSQFGGTSQISNSTNDPLGLF